MLMKLTPGRSRCPTQPSYSHRVEQKEFVSEDKCSDR
jgi:hypothetical protein